MHGEHYVRTYVLCFLSEITSVSVNALKRLLIFKSKSQLASRKVTQVGS